MHDRLLRHRLCGWRGWRLLHREPAETTPEPTEEPATGGMEPVGQPSTRSNATLVDDYYGDKQLITVTTKAGNYFTS